MCKYALVLVVSVQFAHVPLAYAESARAKFLIDKLQTSSHARVRTQAALSLGRVETTPLVLGALLRALRDKHPAVRAAAAASLEQVGDTSVIGPLKRLLRDRSKLVRNAARRAIAEIEAKQEAALYYVGVGVPGSNVPDLPTAVLREVHGFLKERIGGVDGVRLAPDKESEGRARSVISKGNMVGYYVDCSIVKVERYAGGGVRAEVSVILSTYPDHDIRAMMNGAARVTGGDFSSMRRQAIEGAFSGALRRLPQAMEAASGR